MTSNLIPKPQSQLSSETFTKKTSLIARGLNEISLLKPSPESLYQTGMDYYEGSNSKPWDILKAYAYLVKSAEQGFVLAQWRLACMFMVNETAVEKNVEKALYWLEKAALNGHLMAMYELLSDSSETYVQELTHLAENGSHQAVEKLAMHYIIGDHELIKKDMKQAWYWVKRITVQGSFTSYVENATAEFWDEVDKDNGYWLPSWRLPSERYSTAEKDQYFESRMMWLIEKAQQGEAFAQYELGDEIISFDNDWEFYPRSELAVWERVFAALATDEPIDRRQLGIFWLTKAAEQGIVQAQRKLYFLIDDTEKKSMYRRRAEEQGRLAIQANENLFRKARQEKRLLNEDELSHIQGDARVTQKSRQDGLQSRLRHTLRRDLELSQQQTQQPVVVTSKFTFEMLEHYRLNNQDSI